MKLSLKSIFPSTLFNKITLKTAILVALVLFYLVIMFSSSREGLETTSPQPQSIADVQKMVDQVTKKTTAPIESESAIPTEMATSTEMSTPTEMATPTPTPTKANKTSSVVETLASPSKTPYSTY